MGAHEQPPLHPNKQKTTWSAKAGNSGYFVPRPVCAWLACGFVSLALLHLLCCAPPGTQNAVLSRLLQYVDDTYNFVSSGPRRCNYSDGRWVYAPGHARRYNGTECDVKDSHNCIRNGRPDTGYLDWQWQPAGCHLPAFDAKAFLSAARGKHVALVGDSMARNQAQSLACLLAAEFPHRVVYRDPDYPRSRKPDLWRWAFPSHGVTVSFYWAPFLARATGKARNDTLPQNVNHVHLDAPDDRWGADADTMDVVVLGTGHWPLNGAIYYNNGEVIGHHAHDELDPATDIGYARPMRMAYRTALDRLSSGGRPRTVVLATLSPGHKYEGDTLATMCPRKKPYREGEQELRDLDRELVGLVYEEAEAARARNGEGSATKVEVLDVTKLAIMRPDGHPGAYMHRDPFAHEVQPWMAADCVHFCLPGPVDTFNEILQHILRKRR
ncbi:hypothetical protein SEVIR_4G103800v4 [Setaria viridis]|uniref:Uncharacterized protein n=1 Tax=Setaria viridis TaxID=4556 RepID=A0A4U6UVQ3_SETVI|nr:protein ALTERED XYLOGLUCAN 4-like [Setaria viridis]TKW20648.1 hypothetical protein SEVIR_4G103800v2 [Setaria viridis]